MAGLSVAWLFIKGFLAKYWMEILIVIALTVAVGFIYGKGRADGASAANARWEVVKAEWEAKEEKRIQGINTKIEELRTDSKALADRQVIGVTKLQQGVNKVIKDLALLPPSQTTNIYTTKEDCKPTDVYVEKWNAINEEARRSIK